MKKIIFILLFTISITGISAAQESVAAPPSDSSQVEFYTSVEDFLDKNILPSIHITILALTKNIYGIFGGTVDFKVENFPTKKENEILSGERLS